MSLVETRFNTAYRKYYRMGVTDSAHAKVQERLGELYRRYGYGDEAPKSKAHIRDRAPDEFNEELLDIMKDFLDDPDRMIGKENFTRSKQYKEFMRTHEGVTTPQEYIDYVEAIKHGQQAIHELTLMDSDQVGVIYSMARDKKLDTKTTDKIIREAVKRYKGTTIDLLQENIRESIRKYK